MDNSIKKLRKKKEGFTLIELLAVIIILGLLVVAVPAVSEKIISTTKKTYVAHELIDKGYIDELQDPEGRIAYYSTITIPTLKPREKASFYTQSNPHYDDETLIIKASDYKILDFNK